MRHRQFDCDLVIQDFKDKIIELEREKANVLDAWHRSCEEIIRLRDRLFLLERVLQAAEPHRHQSPELEAAIEGVWEEKR